MKLKKIILIASAIMMSFLFCMTLISCDDPSSCTHKSMTTTVVDPTCEKEGYTDRTCMSCGFSYKSEFVAPTGHILTVTETAPDCVNEGFTHYECACGYSFNTDTKAPLGHSFVKTDHLPTCTLHGYTDYACSVCKFSFSSDFLAPTGHSFSTTTTNPTCDSTGFTHYSCGCGYEYIGDFIHYSDIFKGAYAENSEIVAKGIDVSKWNHEVLEDGSYAPLDFSKVKKAGFDFVILKIGSTPRVSATTGEALGGIEPTFKADYTAAKAAGLDVGVYFYTYSSTVADAKADAELVLGWLGDRKLEYPVYFDLEDSSLMSLSRDELTDLCISFISEIQNAKYYGALYTNNNWLVSYLQSDKVTFLFDIWYARYAGTEEWDTEKYGEHMCMWQYTQTGIIPEISDMTKFDFNFAYKDYPSLMKKIGYNGY